MAVLLLELATVFGYQLDILALPVSEELALLAALLPKHFGCSRMFGTQGGELKLGVFFEITLKLELLLAIISETLPFQFLYDLLSKSVDQRYIRRMYRALPSRSLIPTPCCSC